MRTESYLDEKDYVPLDLYKDLVKHGMNIYMDFNDKVQVYRNILIYEVQKWLRKKYQIEIVVLSSKGIGHPYMCDVYFEDDLYVNVEGDFEYEDALVEGIRQSIILLNDLKDDN